MTRNRQNWRTGGNTFLSSPANQCDTARNIRLMSYTVLTRSDVKLAFVFSRSALEKKNLLLFLSLPFFFLFKYHHFNREHNIQDNKDCFQAD